MEERIQKIMAAAGIASRRAAEEIILEGRVRVNGQVVTELGAKADPDKDHIKVDGKLINPQQPKTYLMLNKPAGCVTTLFDPEGRPTVTELLKGVKVRVYPVGRLDYDTEGLLLLTNDGDFAFRVTHPSHELPKTYQVKVKGVLEDRQIDELERGVFLKDGRTAPARVRKLRKEEANSWIEVTIHEGRKRQVRRMIDHTGHSVIKLKRVRVGTLTLGDLPVGSFRHLTPDEVSTLGDMAQEGRGAEAKPSRRPAAAGHVPEFIEGPLPGRRPKKITGPRPAHRDFKGEERTTVRKPWHAEKREGREGLYGGQRREKRFGKPSFGEKRPFGQRDARKDEPFGGKRAAGRRGEQPQFKQRDDRPRERKDFRSGERRPGKPSFGGDRPFSTRGPRRDVPFGGKYAAARTVERPHFKQRDDRPQARTGYRKEERRSGRPFFGGSERPVRQRVGKPERETFGGRTLRQRYDDRRPVTEARNHPESRGSWRRDDRSRGAAPSAGERRPRMDRVRSGQRPFNKQMRTGAGPRPAGRPLGKPKVPGRRRH